MMYSIPYTQVYTTLHYTIKNILQVSAGNCGVWGINSDQCVFYRLNSYGDPDNEGTGWIKIEGKFQQIYSGANCVLALAGNRDIYFR